MKNKGFSLVELSVVIVIIALLMTAIMKGQSLVAEAKLQSIVEEVTQNKVAITSFYNKYGKYPGDFNEGVANWGATTLDGDYNGKIEFKNAAGTPRYEGYIAWQHLAYAGMVLVPYPGTKTTTAAVPGTDIPASKIGGGYMLDYSSSATAYDHTTAGAYGISLKNVMVLGVPAATSASPVLSNGTMTPSQAMSLDTKMDDGNPLTGSVRGADGNKNVDGSTSASGNCISTIYKITLTGKDCILIFKATD